MQSIPVHPGILPVAVLPVSLIHFSSYHSIANKPGGKIQIFQEFGELLS
jgi:hypothetical protein